ncbi:MAG: transcription repressor NadR [Bacillota bacterium]|jgi:transcriptional regulator of NAD metabolism
MGPDERRKRLLDMLRGRVDAVTGSDLADALQVSRQVIVQDVALLRAEGENILSTPRGYVLGTIPKPGVTTVVTSTHTLDQVEDELMTVVDLGGEVLDVIVEHPLYGHITGTLLLRCPDDVRQFVSELRASRARLLSSLTGGTHLHTIRAPDRPTLTRIQDELRRKGFVASG